MCAYEDLGRCRKGKGVVRDSCVGLCEESVAGQVSWARTFATEQPRGSG